MGDRPSRHRERPFLTCSVARWQVVLAAQHTLPTNISLVYTWVMHHTIPFVQAIDGVFDNSVLGWVVHIGDFLPTHGLIKATMQPGDVMRWSYQRLAVPTSTASSPSGLENPSSKVTDP